MSDAAAPALTAAAAQAIGHVAARSEGEPLAPDLRVTINFHPDMPIGRDPMLAVLAREGVYRSQFETGVSSGGLTARPGGDRWLWESRMFGGAYDAAEPHQRPRYGALNYRRWEVGGSPRFGSAHLRLHPHVAARTTFCYPDSHLDPRCFGVASRMGLIALAEENALGLDMLDDYIEAHVHGTVDIGTDVEAVVLDRCYAGTAVEEAARRLPCAVEWHRGFSMPVAVLDACAAYRSEKVRDLLATLAGDGAVTPDRIGAARGSGVDPQLLKQAWHCVARFGSPLG